MLPQFTMIDMYTRASTISTKEQVLSAFCMANGVLRVVIATTAFGMGVHCSDIRHINSLGCNIYFRTICGIAGENQPTGTKFPMEIIDL